jgi:hypothetical protein
LKSEDDDKDIRDVRMEDQHRSQKAEEFADKATDVLYDSLSKLSPEEQERRIAAFENAVKACSSRAKERRSSRTQGFLARTLRAGRAALKSSRLQSWASCRRARFWLAMAGSLVGNNRLADRYCNIKSSGDRRPA